MRRSDLLPPSSHYTHGTHPGVTTWRHARTALTPTWPRWIGEGSACLQTHPEPCTGKRVPYKLDAADSGLCSIEDYAETGTDPAPDAHAGDWICSVCGCGGVIGLDEVQQDADDVPSARRRDDNVLPLFGPREVNRA